MPEKIGKWIASSQLEEPSIVKKCAAFVLGLPIFLYVWFIERTVRVEIINDPPPSLDPSERQLFYTWHRYNFCSVLLLFRAPYSSINLLGHQKFVSLMHSIPGRFTGVSFFNFLRKEGVSGVRQIEEFFQKNSKLLIYSDSGGPYRKMKPGAIELAKIVGASLIPIAFHCTKKIILGKDLQQVLPLPGATVYILFGDAIPFADEPTDAIQTRCEESMTNLLLSLSPPEVKDRTTQ